MELLLVGLMGIAGLVSFVCFIVVVVKMFQNGQTGLGVASIVLAFCTGIIGYIITLVVGWQNADAWKIRNVMMIYTLSFIVQLVAFIAVWAMFGLAMFGLGEDLQNQMQNQQFNGGF